MSKFDRGREIAFEAIADSIGISKVEAFEVYAQLNDLGLINRTRAQEVFVTIAEEV